MAEHELEISTKLGIPEIHGLAAGLEVKYRSTWGARTRDFVCAASAAASMTDQELGARLEADEALRDLFLPALNRATMVKDSSYRQLLAKLVAAACDTARLNEVDYALQALEKLQPIQVQVLMRCWKWLADTNGECVEVSPEEAEDADYQEWSGVRLMSDLRIMSEGLFTSMVGGLVYAGLIEVLDTGPDLNKDEINWYGPTGLAETIVRMAFPHVQFHRPVWRDLPSPRTPDAQSLFSRTISSKQP